MGMSRRSIKLSKGFTLIELVMVIVILGILAAVALPKFVDLSGQASTAAVKGVAGAITAGSAANFAAKKAGLTVQPLIIADVCTNALLGAVLQGGAFPTNFTASAGTGTCVADPTVTCTVTQTAGGGSATTTALVYCSPA